uniref:Uncharacterized protein n=2 Tax=Clytia hemisphaerica TaxID=252671 RepID=A0A7M5UL69_9CNID
MFAIWLVVLNNFLFLNLSEGVTWSAKRDACIKGNNNEVFVSMTFDLCKSHCEQATSYVCASFELNLSNNVCLTSSSNSRSGSYTEPCYNGPHDYAEILDGGWSAWGSWGSCSTACGSGTESRSRDCNNPTPLPGGSCNGPSTESQSCNDGPCPVDGQWGSWTSWNTCTESCAGGTHSRSRSCDSPSPDHGGSQCSGSASDSQSCNTHPCPIHGVWTGWGSWQSCNITCGGGEENRTRTCTNPPPQHGGDPCSGDPIDIQSCNIHPCPIHGNWSQWSNWTECDKPCGVGFQNRSRTCTNPPPQHGGDNCTDHDAERSFCNEHPCTDMCDTPKKTCNCSGVPVIYDMSKLQP